jgi:hypothetical protein
MNLLQYFFEEGASLIRLYLFRGISERLYGLKNLPCGDAQQFKPLSNVHAFKAFTDYNKVDITVFSGVSFGIGAVE